MKKITCLFLMLLSFTAIAQPTTTPPTPSEASADVVSLFSGSYTSSATLNLADFTPPGNTANVISAAGNDVLELVITGGVFHGFNLSNAIDLSAMENLHYDIWIAGTTQVGAIFNTTVSYHAGGHLTGQTTGYVDTNEIAAGQEGTWLSFDVPFSDFAPNMAVNPRDIISQIVFTHVNLSNTGPIYIDNIYFWRESVDPNTDATLSDLTLDGATINGFAPTTFTYNVELPNGTATAPVVAGVATQAGGGATVDVTQAPGVPGSATLEVTAINGTTTQVYTVNFTEAPAQPPAAPTPPAINTISVISDVYTNISVPQVDTFGGTLTNFDLNFDGNEEARLITGGSGFQFNFFPFGSFIDITPAQFLHLDIYCDNLADNDILRIRLLDPDPGANGANIARVQLSAAQSGTWVSVDLELPSGGNLNDFGDIDSAGAPVDLSQLSLIQFNTLDLGSSLASKEVYLSNIYFYGGALSTADETLGQLKVYPNPSNTQWTISSVATIEQIQLFDILGKQVINLNPSNNEVVIDANSLKDGLYLAKVSTANGSSTIKLIKN